MPTADAEWSGRFFPPERTETLAVGEAALGHLRYATAGDDNDSNIQPLVSETKFGPVALAHNGNVVNAQTLRRSLLDEGARFFSSSDTELFLQLLSRSPSENFRRSFSARERSSRRSLGFGGFNPRQANWFAR